jgi:DNA-binding transcriptional ArsR family regulator
MKKFLIVAVIMSLAFASSGATEPAAAPTQTLVVSRSGYYLLTQDNAGVPSLTKITQVIVLGDSPNPFPVPGDLTERGKAIKAASEKVVGDPKRAETAHLLAELYRQIVPLIGQQAKGYDQIMLSISTATNIALKDDATRAAWKPVRELVTEETKNLSRAGAPDGDYAKYFLECADGYDASSPLKQISPDVLKFILQIIQLILSLLKPM